MFYHGISRIMCSHRRMTDESANTSNQNWEANVNNNIKALAHVWAGYKADIQYEQNKGYNTLTK